MLFQSYAFTSRDTNDAFPMFVVFEVGFTRRLRRLTKPV